MDIKTHPLRAYRRANNLRLEDIALAVGKSAVSLSRIERRQQDPPLSVLLRIREATNYAVSLDDFPAPQTGGGK